MFHVKPLARRPRQRVCWAQPDDALTPPGHLEPQPVKEATMPDDESIVDTLAKPLAVKPVAYRGRMTPAGYQPENHEWRDWLCSRNVDGRLTGKDPMLLPIGLLAAAGHPNPSPGGIRGVLLRLRVMHGVHQGEARHDGFLGLGPDDLPKRVTEIREAVCKPCSSGSLAEIRHCAIYDCPCWPFRMGKNPHNPQRGKDMSAVRAAIGPEAVL